MPTNQNAYNSRVTDEALEKRFRDTFRSQGGAELVDDLYASGVIVPIVDFTSAAEGSQLGQNLQTAWDFSTGSIQINTNAQTNIITNSGFWLVDLTHSGYASSTGLFTAQINIFDGTSAKVVWARTSQNAGSTGDGATTIENKFVVFLRAGDSLRGKCQFSAGNDVLDVWYRQIADVSGNLVNPTGFTSS